VANPIHVGDGFKPSRGGGAGENTHAAVTQGYGRDMSRPYITQHHPTRFRGWGCELRLGWSGAVKYGDTICRWFCSRRADRLSRVVSGTVLPMVSPHFA